MQSIQELRERLTLKAQEVRKLHEDNSANWKPEHQSAYDAGMGEVEAIRAQIKRQEMQDAIDADLNKEAAVKEVVAKKAHDTKGPHAVIFRKWLAGGDRALNFEDWKIYNTMSTTTGSEGGHTVPTEVVGSVVDKLKFFGGMRQAADVFSTSGFGDMNFPASDGTAEVGELIGQNTTATAADPSFSVVSLTAYKYSSKIVAVPFELLQDTAIDMEGFIANRLAQRLGRITNTHFTTGTGSGQPNGVVTATSAGRTGATGSTVTCTFDDLVLMIHSIDPAYRQMGRCRWMMNDTSLGIVRRLKDSQNRPVFIPGWDGLSGAMSDRILGYDVVVNQDVANMAANAKSMLFGDFSYYKIRDVMGMTMFRFDDSAYVKLGQIGFLAWMRSGGNLVETAAVKHYANSAT